MGIPELLAPAVVAAIVASLFGFISLVVNRGTTIGLHRERLRQEMELAERKAAADVALAEAKFRLDASLADRKRKQDLAEDVLSGFHQAVAILRTVRSPIGFEGEGRDRPRSEGQIESESVARLRDTYYAPIARYAVHRESMGNLLAKRYRMVAWFGVEAAKPFDDLNEVVGQITVAATSLMVHADLDGYRRLNPAQLERWEGVIWFGSTDDDPVSDKIDDALAAMEAICRPILQTEDLVGAKLL